MSEELKIIIKAITSDARKEVGKVTSEINKMSGAAKSSGGKVSAAFTAVKKYAAVAAAAVSAVAGVVIALSAALLTLGNRTKTLVAEQAKLNAAFAAAGAKGTQAAETYEDLYRFLGDSGKATEAAAHLAKITNEQQKLAEWSKIAQGVYATFGDSLPIEGLTEAANESIRVGQVTGVLADALNWAGVSEDAFNAKLATTASLEEREALLRSTLNGLYMDAANIYEANNQKLLALNESQARLDTAMAAAGSAVQPLQTAVNNLGAAFFTALKPAIDAIVPPLVTFVNWITKAVQAVLSLFGVVSGSSASVEAIGDIGGSVAAAAGGMGDAASGAGDLSKGLGSAAKAAEKVKRSVMGFDELNILPSGSSVSGGSGGGGSAGGGSSGAPGYASPGSGGGLGAMAFTAEVQETESKTGGLIGRLKGMFAGLGDVFAPSVEAWRGAWGTVRDAFKESLPHYTNGAREIAAAFEGLGGYLVNDFVPEVVNSFSVNLAPVVGDVFGFAIVEGAKAFEHVGGVINKVTQDYIIPALDFIKQTTTDTFDIIGAKWEEHGAPLLESFSGVFESLRGHFDNAYNALLPLWEYILQVAGDAWDNGLKPLVDKVVDAVLVITTELNNFYNKVLAPIIDWILKNIVPVVVDVAKSVLKTTGELIKSVSKSLGGVITTTKGIIQFLVGVFTLDWRKAWDGIKNIFKGIFDTLSGILGTAKASFKGILDFIKVTFLGSWKIAWSSVSATFSAIWSAIKKTASDAWEGIKRVFSGVGSFFGGIWSTIKSKFTDLGTKLGSAISNSVKSGINGVLTMIENTINRGISLINGAIDLINKLPNVNVSKLNKLSLPRLAQGGIVGSATVAMIGEAGKEAVLPLENNTEWMDRLADKIAARNNTPTKLVLQLKEKELGWAVIDAINGITQQRGGIPLTI